MNLVLCEDGAESEWGQEFESVQGSWGILSHRILAPNTSHTPLSHHATKPGMFSLSLFFGRLLEYGGKNEAVDDVVIVPPPLSVVGDSLARWAFQLTTYISV
ncbi:unnamed protein product [Boreogadus saida]